MIELLDLAPALLFHRAVHIGVAVPQPSHPRGSSHLRSRAPFEVMPGLPGLLSCQPKPNAVVPGMAIRPTRATLPGLCSNLQAPRLRADRLGHADSCRWRP